MGGFMVSNLDEQEETKNKEKAKAGRIIRRW